MRTKGLYALPYLFIFLCVQFATQAHWKYACLWQHICKMILHFCQYVSRHFQSEMSSAKSSFSFIPKQMNMNLTTFIVLVVICVMVDQK